MTLTTPTAATTPWYELQSAEDHELDRLAAEFCLHTLHIEDVRSDRNERTKVDVSPDYTYALLRVPELSDTEEADAGLLFHTVHIFASQRFCITVADESNPAVRTVFERAHLAAPHAPPVRLLYLIFDSIVDSIFPIFDTFDDRIDDLQDKVIACPEPEQMQAIFDVKAALTHLRRLMVNLRDGALQLQRAPGTLVDDAHQIFVRDIYDHTVRLLDLLETQRDLLNNTLDVYLSSVANRTNEVMKVLTVLSTIALPALVITGIYGMNIKGLPFLNDKYGAEVVFLITGLITVGLLLWFRRRRWF
jgi:magnesium transporter